MTRKGLPHDVLCQAAKTLGSVVVIIACRSLKHCKMGRSKSVLAMPHVSRRSHVYLTSFKERRDLQRQQ